MTLPLIHHQTQSLKLNRYCYISHKFIDKPIPKNRNSSKSTQHSTTNKPNNIMHLNTQPKQIGNLPRQQEQQPVADIEQHRNGLMNARRPLLYCCQVCSMFPTRKANIRRYSRNCKGVSHVTLHYRVDIFCRVYVVYVVTSYFLIDCCTGAKVNEFVYVELEYVNRSFDNEIHRASF